MGNPSLRGRFYITLQVTRYMSNIPLIDVLFKMLFNFFDTLSLLGLLLILLTKTSSGSSSFYKWDSIFLFNFENTRSLYYIN